MQTDAGAVAPPDSPSPPIGPVDPPASHPEGHPDEDVKHASTTFLVIVSGISLAADLASKAWAKHHLSGFDGQKLGPKKMEIIKDYLDFIYALNPGGAWSFLRSLPDSLRRPFFLFVSASAVVFIVSIYRRVPHNHTAMRWGLPLALGGAMGNLVDRIRYGQVIDFIDMYVVRGGREVHWPTYNVADIAIVAGVALMIIDMIVPARRPRTAEAPALAGAPAVALADGPPLEVVEGSPAPVAQPSTIAAAPETPGPENAAEPRAEADAGAPGAPGTRSETP